MPGFVDAGLLVSMRADAASATKPARPKKTRQIYDDGLALLRSCLHHGTVAAELRSGSDLEDFRADTAMLRQLTKIGSNPVDIVRTWRISRPIHTEVERQEFRGALGVLARRKLVDFVEVSGAALAISDDLLWDIRQANVGMKLAWDGGDEKLLEDVLRRIMPRTVACPPTLSEAEFAALVKFPAIVVFSPTVDLAHGPGPGLKRFLEWGGAVALSSGYDAHRSPGFSMQMAVSLAIVQGQLSPEEAIAAATINAAYAMGYGHVTGSLEQGKRADILVVNVPDHREIARRFGINHAAMVLRNGVTAFNRTRWKIGA